jgi:hypothetical protein
MKIDATQNRADLLGAIAGALAEDHADVGLSANRIVCSGVVEWDVVLRVDHSKTVIDSEIDYRTQSADAIAAVILDCWDAEWDD